MGRLQRLASSSSILLLLTIFITSNEVVKLSTASKLSARRVLLPYNLEIPTNYTLEVVDGGCYKWTSSRPDVASISQVTDSASPQEASLGCSSKAIVSVVSRLPKRQSTIVLALEVGTGVTFRADVEVDVIKQIEIITTTREIALDDVPERFEVHAKNDQNDTFTCLGGIEFEWTVQPIGADGLEGTNLRFRKFSDTAYDVPSSTEYWEKRDKHGAMILIEGSRTGSAKVRAKIRDSAYAEVPAHEITLRVVANLYLVPSSDTFMIPYSTIAFSAQLVKGQQSNKLTLPSEQYYLELTDPKVARLNMDTCVVTALKVGSASIILKDKNIKPGAGLRQPTAEIIVMRPSYMTSHVTPGENWALQEYTTYVITLQIYDDHHHRLQRSDNLDLKVTFASQYFHVNSSTLNGTHHVVRTINGGTTRIKAVLNGAFKVDGSVAKLDIPIELVQEVKIYQTLKISPPLILLPWDPVEKPSYTVYPRAQGATGFFRWESLNPGQASVTYRVDTKESARASVTTHGLGDTTLVATDIYNSVFRDTSRISVQPVIDIDLVLNILETRIGSSVYLPLALYGYEDEPKKKVKKVFDDCSQIPVKVEVVEKTRFEYVDEDEDGKTVPGFNRACRSLRFDCKAVGHSRVWVTYETPDGKISMNTTAVISCYYPLKLVHPNPIGILALGTSVELTFEGGPRKWPLNEEGHYNRLVPDADNLLNIEPILDPYRYRKDLHVFRATCTQLGETALLLSVGNLASATLPSPSIEKQEAKLICDVPVTFQLKPKMKADENCPLVSGSSAKIPVSNSHAVEVEINAKDASGRKFLNITSLEMDWLLSDYTLAKLTSNKEFVEEVNGANGFRKWTRNYQLVHPVAKSEGDLRVAAKSTQYRRKVLVKEGISHYKEPSSPIEASVVLSLVEKPTINPSEASLFNHKSNKLTLQISKGSGHFKVEPLLAFSGFANLTYFDTVKHIEISPLHDGLISVKVTDLCVDHGSVSGAPDASAKIRVVDPKDIRVVIPDKAELGSELEARVEVIDTTGEPIPSALHQLMNLHPEVGSDILVIKAANSLSNAPENELFSRFTLKAEKLGRTRISFKTGPISGTKLVSSPEINIEVFSPLRVLPSEITLVVGSVFEVIVSGGPQPDSSVEYLVDNEKVALVSGTGLLEGKKIGVTKLTARAVSTGSSLLYSQDQVTVKVVPIHGIKIVCPTKQILIGSEMPLTVTAYGPDNELLTPFSFGSALPKIKISWSVKNREVLEVNSVYSKLGISENYLNMFAVRVVGRQEGAVTVRVSVEVTEKATSAPLYQIKNNDVFSDTVIIRVFSPLSLTSTSTRVSGGLLLMSPGSEVALKSTRDAMAKVTFALKEALSKVILEKGSMLKSTLASDATQVTLEAKSQESFGVVQVVDYMVQVKPVSYLILTPIKTLHSRHEDKRGERLFRVPLGSTISFDVNFCDSMGQTFEAVNAKINVRLSRYGLISWTSSTSGDNNHTVTVKGSREGTTIIRVWTQNELTKKITEEYIYIDVGQVISPRVPILTVGDIVCFSSPLTTPEGQNGIYELEGDSNSLDFFGASNQIALVKKSGQFRVKQNLSSFATTSTLMSASSPRGLQIDTRSVDFITNNRVSEAKILIPLIIVKDSITNQMPPIPSSCSQELIDLVETPFDCSVSFDSIQTQVKASEVFTCDVIFDMKTNAYALAVGLFSSSSRSDANQLLLATTDSNVTFTVVDNNLSAKLSASVSLPFYSSFHVHSQELILSNTSPLGYVVISTVSGVKQSLTVTPENDETQRILDIYPIEEAAPLSASSSGALLLKIPIQLKKIDHLSLTSENALKVRVTSSTTKQSEVVLVNVKWILEGPQCLRLMKPTLDESSSDFMPHFLRLPIELIVDSQQLLLTILCTFAICLVGFKCWSLRKTSADAALNQTTNQSFANKTLSGFGSVSGPGVHSPSFASSSDSRRRVLNYSLDAASPDLSPAGSGPSTPRGARPLWTQRN